MKKTTSTKSPSGTTTNRASKSPAKPAAKSGGRTPKSTSTSPSRGTTKR